MDDAETLTAESAQVIRRSMVSALSPYRLLIPLLPLPSYVRDAVTAAIAALDRWTKESRG